MLIVMALFNWFVIFVFLGMFISNAWVAAAIAGAFVFGLAWLSTTEVAEKFFRFTHGMRRPIKKEADVLQPILEELCRRAGVEKVPTLCVVDEPFPNAYALGTNTVCVTRGMLKSATEEEMMGVLAHELGHLKYGDSKRSLIAHTLNQAGNLAAFFILIAVSIMSIFSRAVDRTGFIGLAFAVFVAFLKLGVWIMQKALDLGFLAIGRQAEYRADAYAIELGVGEGLHSFLEKIQDMDFATKGFWARLEATHPPVAFRLERLDEALENQDQFA